MKAYDEDGGCVCSNRTRGAAARGAPSTKTEVALPPAPTTTASAVALPAPCLDPTEWLRWLVEQAKTREPEALRRVGLAQQKTVDDLDVAADALARAAAGGDASAVASAISEAEAVIAKHPPVTCERRISGRIPPEVIQGIVRHHFGSMKRCYEDALARDPTLAGRVATKFVIGRNGDVGPVMDMNMSQPPDELPDEAARRCVVRAFAALEFPRPKGGIVTVVYPLVFQPGP